jgi:ParB/RepB/Spo0J family partition protein
VERSFLATVAVAAAKDGSGICPLAGTHARVDKLPDTSAADHAPQLMVRCLGSFELQIRGAAVDGWRRGKTSGLFQYLVNHRNRPVRRERLIEALWPDPDALAADTSLRVAVHGLRKQLLQLGAGRAAPVVVTDEAAYQLTGGDVKLDVEDFERYCALGRSLEAQGQPVEAQSMYAQAAGVYRGDFLPESWADWIILRRERLKDEFLFVLARLAEAALNIGDYSGCIQRCQQILDQDNCREDTYRTLMVCHTQLGQPARARRWYELCVRVLRAELDIAPEAETEAVFQQSQQAQATTTATTLGQSVRQLNVALIPVGDVDETPPELSSRGLYDDTAIDELAASIRRHGVLQPLCVRPNGARYTLVFGTRRLRAAVRAGLGEVPCSIRVADDDRAFLLNTIENLHQQRLSISERLRAIQKLAATNLGVREISRRTGFAHTTISRWLKIDRRPLLLEAVESARLDIGRAMVLASASDAALPALLAEAPTLPQPELWRRVGELNLVHTAPARVVGSRELTQALRLVRLVQVVGEADLPLLDQLCEAVERLQQTRPHIPSSWAIAG